MIRTHTRAGISSGVAVAAVVAGVAAVAAPPVAAGQLESGSFDFSENYDHEECGFPLAFEDSIKGKYMISKGTAQTGGQFFRLKQRVAFTSTVTNPATGKFFTETWRVSFRELPAKLVEGEDGVVTYQAKESGQWDIFRDSDGKVVYRNVGNVVWRYKFDTLGDSQPGGVTESEDLVRVSGRFDTFDRDFCDIATELIGPKFPG
jgi:hypothetical protein